MLSLWKNVHLTKPCSVLSCKPCSARWCTQELYRRDEMQHVAFPLAEAGLSQCRTQAQVQEWTTQLLLLPPLGSCSFLWAAEMHPGWLLLDAPLRHSCPAWRAPLTPMLRDHVPTCSNSRNVKPCALLSWNGDIMALAACDWKKKKTIKNLLQLTSRQKEFLYAPSCFNTSPFQQTLTLLSIIIASCRIQERHFSWWRRW